MKHHKPELTVLSYGIGQDSTALLYRYVYDRKFRERYAPGRFIVVVAETGDEHPATYDYLEKVKVFCREQQIEFYHITPDLGFHSKIWQSLNHFYNAYKAIGSKSYPKTCTDKLKLVPIYKFVEDYLGKTYGVRTGRKRGLYEFAERYGKIRVLIGIAQGEEKRCADVQADPNKWKRETVEIEYPLIDLGMDRAGCQKYIAKVGHEVPTPSNCRRCPFMSEEELVWMHRFMPDVFEDWVRQERVKLEANTHKGDKNFGVWGKKTLPEVLARALEKFGDWTDEQLHDYKMSHGHCVASKY